MTDQITVPRKTWDATLEALEALLKRDKRNTCQHEKTHRGGVIWEICEGCGMKWADDRGEKPKWKNPPEWDAAELALTAANAVSVEPVGINGLTEAETSASMSVMGLSRPTVQPQAQGEADKLMHDCFEILDSFSYENDEDSQSKAFFKAHIDVDWFFYVKNSLERQLKTEAKK